MFKGPGSWSGLIGPISLTMTSLLASVYILKIPTIITLFALEFIAWIGFVVVRAVLTPERIDFWSKLWEIKILPRVIDITPGEVLVYRQSVLDQRFRHRIARRAQGNSLFPADQNAWTSSENSARDYYVTTTKFFESDASLTYNGVERRSAERRHDVS